MPSLANENQFDVRVFFGEDAVGVKETGEIFAGLIGADKKKVFLWQGMCGKDVMDCVLTWAGRILKATTGVGDGDLGRINAVVFDDISFGMVGNGEDMGRRQGRTFGPGFELG